MKTSIVTLSLLITILVATTAHAADLSTGLIGWWKFDEGSGTSAADASGNGHAGTLSGSVLPQWTTGRFGGALDFSGSSTTVVTVTLPSLSNYTVNAWIYYTQSGGNDCSSLLCPVAALDGDDYVGIDADQMEWLNPGWSTLGSISPGQWNMVTYRTDQSGGQMYLNAVFVADVGASIPWSIAFLGNDGNSHNFAGLIDDLRIYNRALTDAEILALHQGPGRVAGGSHIANGRISH